VTSAHVTAAPPRTGSPAAGGGWALWTHVQRRRVVTKEGGASRRLLD
jgi:hypothetical protein